MENTLENKARFFAQYWGQKVNINSMLLDLNSIDYDGWLENSFLILKHISSMTNEDAIEVYDLVYVSDFKPKFKIGEIKKTLLKNFHEEFTDFSPKDFLLIFDNLRSKGYALPWMGLSVEKLIEYGWVKLKTLN